MSLADDAKLLLIPTGYKTSKVYSVFPTDGDGDFDYTRSGDASRVNPGGLIETVGTNIPRIDHFGGGCPTLNLEPQRTNLMESSEDFGYTGYSQTRCSVDSTNLISPDGTLNGNKIESTNTSVANIREFLSITAGNDFSMSFFVKKGTGTHISTAIFNAASSSFVRYFVDLETMEYDGSLAEVGTEISLISREIIDYGNGWHRIITNISTNTTTGLNIYIYPQTNGTTFASTIGEYNYFWGWQTEVGTYPTSYIKTTTGTVTRLVDSCEVASGLENLINQTEGVFYIEFEYLYETTTDSSTDANRDILVLGTASDISEGISIDNFRSQFRVFIQGSGMTTQSVGNNTTGSSQPNTRYKLAVNYKSGDNKAYLNGSLLGSVQTGDVNFVTNLDGIFFSYNSGSRPFKNQKKVYDLRVYDTALTDNELIELTTL
jgi:hypothetical protein